MHRLGSIVAGTAILFGSVVYAEQVRVEIHEINESGIGAPVGAVVANDSAVGLKLTPNLKGLPPGPHGFHVHEFPDCNTKEKDGKPVAGLAAGDHFDPKETGKHAGPEGDGHAGDLPVLNVASDGTAKEAVVARRLRVADLKGHSLVIHAEGDDYADKPGGARIACGVVK